MARQIRCPVCNTVCELPDAGAGSPLRCPACASSLTVDSGRRRAGPESVAPTLATRGPDETPARDGSAGAAPAEARAGKAGKRRRRPKRRRRTGPGRGLLVGAGLGAVGLLLVLALGIHALTRRAHPPQPAAAPVVAQVLPAAEPLGPAVPPAPVAPPQPEAPALWEVQPDPAPAPAEGPALPETLRMPISLTPPLFAALDGPFFLDLPDPGTTAQVPTRVYDLRTGKEVGTMDAKALRTDALGIMQLSPDGQYLVSRSMRVPGTTADVWKLGADQPRTLPIGNLRWLDFRSADELVTVSLDERKCTVQTWGVPGWELRRSAEVPVQPALPGVKVRGANAAISPGRKYLALVVDAELHVIDLAAGKVVGTTSWPGGRCTNLRFSPDGAELLAVGFNKDDGRPHSWLRTWKMTDGRPARPAVELNLIYFAGGLLPGPDADSLLCHNDTRTSASTPPAQVVDRSTGTPIFDLPYVPVRWLGPGRLLALTGLKYEWSVPVRGQQREVFVAAFDQKQYLARAGGARGASALRPIVTPGDRKAVKALRPEPAGWAVPADAPPPGPAVKSAAVQIEEGDVLFAPRAGQVSCVFQLTPTKPVWRISLNWSRYDLRTGKPLGDPVELWPWTKREDKATEPPGSNPLPPSLSADGRRLVVRDPAHVTWGRVDVWEADAGRVLGLLPYGGPAVEWHGWAADGRLLTVGDGKLTAWDVPAGRAVFEVAGNYAGRAALSPGRAWVVVPAVGHLDVLDTATGACLGRLDSGGVPPRAWSRLAMSPDGRRLAALKWAPQQPRAVHTWDLDSGKARESFPMPPGGGWLLLWYGERHVLAGDDLVDLELHTAVAKDTVPGKLAELAEGPVHGRLWCVSVPKPAAPAQILMPVAPPEDGPPRGALVACPAPDPAVVEVLPAAPPADPAVVFHPGMEVALDVDCGDPGRTARATAAMAAILRRDGFKVGPGSGWKIVVKGEQYDIRLPLAPGEDASAVPAVRGRVTLHAPDGTVVGGEDHRSDIARQRSKYERRASRDDPPGSRRYDFEGRTPREALAEEYWDAWMTSLDKPKWPRALMRYQGRYEPLPATVTLDPVPPGS